MGLSLRETLARHTMIGAPELVIPESRGAVRCLACGHRCHVMPGHEGVCKVRFNRDGEMYVPGGYVAALQIDPIEKKPFFHAFPGHEALSFGMLGCDLHCGYCQNWVTSQALRDEEAISDPQLMSGAEGVVEVASANNVEVLVSTYNEPLITSEWAVEIFKVARKADMTCGFVSNGNATREVLEFLKPHCQLYKVDLKGFRDKPYRTLGGVLQNVLDTIEMLIAMKFWVEIVTLIIPGFNDSDEELRDIARFIAGHSISIPWHVTAFHPDYKMNDTPGTPAKTLLRAHEIGREEGLQYVYPGNLPGQVGTLESTFCPSCNDMVIERSGFRVIENRLENGACPGCKQAIPGVWGSNPLVSSKGQGYPRQMLP